MVAPVWKAQGLEPRPYGGCYDHLYLDIFPSSLSTGDASHVAAADQFENAAACARVGCGLVLQPPEVEGERVRGRWRISSPSRVSGRTPTACGWSWQRCAPEVVADLLAARFG